MVIATTRDGYTAKAVDLGIGSVWVTSQGTGQLALLDGASAAVTVRLKVADGGHDITAVQGHRAGYAVDHTAGTVIRADDATWHATATVPIDGATTGLTATAAGPALYLTDVQRGLVVKTDPDTLQPLGQPQSLSATRGAGTPVADTIGALWLLDSTNGDLIRMVDTPQRTDTGFAQPAADSYSSRGPRWWSTSSSDRPHESTRRPVTAPEPRPAWTPTPPTRPSPWSAAPPTRSSTWCPGGTACYESPTSTAETATRQSLSQTRGPTWAIPST